SSISCWRSVAAEELACFPTAPTAGLGLAVSRWTLAGLAAGRLVAGWRGRPPLGLLAGLLVGLLGLLAEGCRFGAAGRFPPCPTREDLRSSLLPELPLPEPPFRFPSSAIM